MPCNKTCIFQQMTDNFRAEIARLEKEKEELRIENDALKAKLKQTRDELFEQYFGWGS